MFALDYSELVDHQPIVVRGAPVVEEGDLRTAHSTPGGPVLDRHAIHEQAVEGTVAGFQRRALGASELAERVVQGLGGQVGVQPVQGVAQLALQNDLGVVGPFRAFRGRGDVGTVGYLPPEAFEPFERGGFDVRLGECRHHFKKPGSQPRQD